MAITIDEVAKKAGVSKTTVSRIINGNFSQVGEETKKRVLGIIDELGYRPNALAKGLKSTKTNVIGIVLSNLQNPFWMSVLEGVEDTCRNSGYNLMICNSNDESVLEEEHIRGLLMRRVDGVIVNPTINNLDFFQSLISSEYPVVLVNRKLTGVNTSTVVVDNILGAKQATEHLIKLGSKDISLIVYPPNGVSPRLERIEGFKRAYANLGLRFDEKCIHIVEEKRNEVKRYVMHLLSSPDRPKAIFSTNNTMTLEIIDAINESNLTIPPDISLVSYDETVWSRHLTSPLTTVSQPSYEMGHLAAKKLIELLNSEKKIEPEEIILRPELIVRKSCGA